MANGRQLYASHCAKCHGDSGDGNGPAARFLYPKPRNFRLGQFRIVTTDKRLPSDDDLATVIGHGMPGSAMFSFGHLPESDRAALIAHMRLLIRQGADERLRRVYEETGDEVDAKEFADAVADLTTPGKTVVLPADSAVAGEDTVSRGRALYVAQGCASCHGETGKGDGVQEQKDDDGTPTRPRDFTRGIFKGGRGPQQLFARIVNGMPGTPMPSSPNISPGDAVHVVNFIRSLSPESDQARVEHARRTIVARNAGSGFSDGLASVSWDDVPAVKVVVSPLWWRDYPEPDFTVQAQHDGQSLLLRLSWHDPTPNAVDVGPDQFEDMVTVQLFHGKTEPFLGMGDADGTLDLWQWRAAQAATTAHVELMDDYPFDAPVYRELAEGGPMPDFITARAAGNPLALREHTGANQIAQGFGSMTFRPKASQIVEASPHWQDDRWSVVLHRPLDVPAEQGLALAAGQRYSAAFAVWDGEARDRGPQKLVSIWHDLQLD